MSNDVFMFSKDICSRNDKLIVIKSLTSHIMYFWYYHSKSNKLLISSFLFLLSKSSYLFFFYSPIQLTKCIICYSASSIIYIFVVLTESYLLYTHVASTKSPYLTF